MSAADSLAVRFREEQATLGNASALAVGALWEHGFRWSDARTSWAVIKPGVTGIMSRQYLASAESGRQYYNASRVAAGLGPLAAKVAGFRLAPERSALVADSTGLGAFLHSVGLGVLFKDADGIGQRTLVGATQNLVLSGGRDMVVEMSRIDPRGIGVKRITGGTCKYCEALAADGDFSGSPEFRAHDFCQCTGQPGFRTAGSSGPSFSGVINSLSKLASSDDVSAAVSDMSDDDLIGAAASVPAAGMPTASKAAIASALLAEVRKRKRAKSR